jgi:hypothetical protein
MAVWTRVPMSSYCGGCRTSTKQYRKMVPVFRGDSASPDSERTGGYPERGDGGDGGDGGFGRVFKPSRGGATREDCVAVAGLEAQNFGGS